MKKRKTAARNRPLTFETLEPRLPLAGEVLIDISNGNMKVTGDDDNNDIRFFQQNTPGEFIVLGVQNTTIKVNGDPFNSGETISGVTNNIKFDMKEGRDVAMITGIDANTVMAANIDFKMGPGPDQPIVSDAKITGKVSIDAGKGDVDTDNDVPTLRRFSIAQTLTIKTGKGPDTVVIDGGEVLGNVSIKTELGADRVLIEGGTKFGKNLTINTGKATNLVDQVRITFGNEILGKLSITTGDGNDSITIDNAKAKTASIKTGAGNDTINVANETPTNVVAVDQALISLGAGNDTVTIGNGSQGKLTLNGPKKSKITGGAGDDTINGAGKLTAGSEVFLSNPLKSGIEHINV